MVHEGKSGTGRAYPNKQKYEMNKEREQLTWDVSSEGENRAQRMLGTDRRLRLFIGIRWRAI